MASSGVWEFQDLGNWVRYSSSDARALENAFNAGQTTLLLGHAQQYQINLTTMTQVNTNTQYSRSIRRSSPPTTTAPSTMGPITMGSTHKSANSAPTWSFYGDHGWIECTRSEQDSAVYEALYQQCIATKTPIASLDAGGFTYTLDFLSMTQTNEDYGTTRRLDRNPRPINCPLQSLAPSTPTVTSTDVMNEYRQYLTIRQNSTTMVPIPKRNGTTKIESHIKSELARLNTAAQSFSTITFKTTPLSYFQTPSNFTDSAPYVSYEHYVAWVEAVENNTTGSFPYSSFIDSQSQSDTKSSSKLSRSSKSSSSKSDKKDKKKDKKKSGKKDKKEKKDSTGSSSLATMALPDPNNGFMSWFPSLDLNPFTMVFGNDDCGNERCDGDEEEGMEQLPQLPQKPPQIDDQDVLQCAICMCALWERGEDDGGATGSGNDSDDDDDDDDGCCDQDDCVGGQSCGRKSNKKRFPKDLFEEKSMVQLPCSHLLHTTCLVGQFQGAGSHSGSCPICKAPILITSGPMPDADCRVSFTKDKCAGFPTSPGTIYLAFTLHGGLQDSRHRNPRVPFDGDVRQHVMPQTPFTMGVLLPLFLKAFFYRHLFDIGHSFTRNQDNVIIYSSIHLKTSPRGGVQSHGYPDPAFPQQSINELLDCNVKLYEDELL